MSQPKANLDDVVFYFYCSTLYKTKITKIRTITYQRLNSSETQHTYNLLATDMCEFLKDPSTWDAPVDDGDKHHHHALEKNILTQSEVEDILDTLKDNIP